MRVLLVNTSETVGGAAVAANRLLRALNRNGVEAELLVRDKQTENPRVIALQHQRAMKLKFMAERLQIFCNNGFTRRGLFAVDNGGFGTDITSLPEFKRADVVHLHWVNQGMLSLKDVKAIVESGKRVVWTMHDMWPFTGCCHHAAKCDRWKNGCGNCPLLNKPGNRDLSWQTWHAKERAYGKGRIAFVGCSNWLTDLARQSPLLRGCRVESIPNALDATLFSPASRTEARRRLGLPEKGKLILFVAAKVTNPYKGISYLRDAIENLCATYPVLKESLGVVAVGQEADRLKDTFPTPVHAVNYVADPGTMADYYRAADVLAMPTLQDNLPNTVAEAMACGIPVVAFEIGGLPQMIDHGENGRLAQYMSAESLVTNLFSVLTDSQPERFAEAARRKAVKEYSEQAVANRYRQIYEQP